MTYDVYIIRQTEKDGTLYELDKSFSMKDKADKHAEKLKSKHKKATIKVCAIPEISVGYKLYRNGKYYGTITRETNSFWIVTNEEKELTGDSLRDENPYLKENFELRFVKDIFDSVSEEVKEEIDA